MTGRLLAIAYKIKPRQPMTLTEAATISAENGVENDLRGGVADRQVTIVFEDDWRAACAALGEDVPWTHRRANLLVSGVANPRRAGGVIRIGGVLLHITGETEPCSLMDKQREGLRAALTPDWRAGVTTNVREGGPIRVGDAVTLEA